MVFCYRMKANSLMGLGSLPPHLVPYCLSLCPTTPLFPKCIELLMSPLNIGALHMLLRGLLPHFPPLIFLLVSKISVPVALDQGSLLCPPS